jgi:hypothetical protein
MRFVNTLFEESVVNLVGVLQQISGPLENAGIPHELIGGLAVFIHVERANSEHGRTTKDVDIMIRRDDLQKTIDVAEHHGFRFRHAAGLDMLQYGDSGKAKDAIHLLFSGEKVRPNQIQDNPPMAPELVHHRGANLWIIPVGDLVQMKLTTYRLVDQVHIQDMDEAGLITPDIENKLSPELSKRLREVRGRE